MRGDQKRNETSQSKRVKHRVVDQLVDNFRGSLEQSSRESLEHGLVSVTEGEHEASLERTLIEEAHELSDQSAADATSSKGAVAAAEDLIYPSAKRTSLVKRKC